MKTRQKNEEKETAKEKETGRYSKHLAGMMIKQKCVVTHAKCCEAPLEISLA